MGIMECEEMKELSPCTLHRRKTVLDEGRCSWASREDRDTCSSKWNSQKAMNHSREVHSNSLLFTHSMYSVRKCYFLNAASLSTSATNYTENYGVKTLASILVWNKDTTINSSVLTSTFFFPCQNHFHAVFFPTQPKATVILALHHHINQQ